MKEIAVIDSGKLLNCLKKSMTSGDVLIGGDGVRVLDCYGKEIINCDLTGEKKNYVIMESDDKDRLVEVLEDVQGFVKIVREDDAVKFIADDHTIFTAAYQFIGSNYYVRKEPMVEVLLEDMKVEVPFNAWDEYLDGLLRRVSDRVNRKVHIIIDKTGKMVMKNKYKSLTTKVKGNIPENIHFVTDLYTIRYIHRLTKNIILTRSSCRLGVILPESILLLRDSYYWIEE